jgi:hypothetical protein
MFQPEPFVLLSSDDDSVNFQALLSLLRALGTQADAELSFWPRNKLN